MPRPKNHWARFPVRRVVARVPNPNDGAELLDQLECGHSLPGTRKRKVRGCWRCHATAVQPDRGADA